MFLKILEPFVPSFIYKLILSLKNKGLGHFYIKNSP